MPSIDQSSTASTPSPKTARNALSGPAPKAQEEDFGGLGEDGMPLNPTGGDPAVQFISNADPANGDAKIEISDPVGTPNFVGLGKEELMKYANDPYWIRLRWALFILFWILWVGMLAGAVIIIIMAPKCSDKKTDPDTYYQVYVKSFAKDGKLADLENHSKYLKDLGVTTVIISQVLQTESGGGTQNVVDFQNVDPTYGTLDNFKAAVKAFKDQGLSVLLQLIPNHSGVDHKWFNDSSKRDYYVRKSEEDVQGSTWKTREGKEAWETDPTNSSDKYLRQLGDLNADLNYANDDVIKEMKDVLKFWQKQGVSGFLLSDVSYLWEDLTQLKNPLAMKNQPNNSNIVKRIIPSGVKVVLLDTDGLEFNSEKYNQYEESLLESFTTPIVTDLNLKLSKTSQGEDVGNIVERLENGNKTNLVLRLSGPRIDRLEKRLGSRDRANLVALVAFSMKSKVILYYGDERNDVIDPAIVASSGGPEVPMKWEDNADTVYFKSLISTQTIMNADKSTETVFNSTGGIFTIKRTTDACKYVAATNFGPTDVTIQFSDMGLPSSAKATVLVQTPNNQKGEETITEGKLELPANGGAIIKFEN